MVTISITLTKGKFVEVKTVKSIYSLVLCKKPNDCFLDDILSSCARLNKIEKVEKELNKKGYKILLKSSLPYIPENSEVTEHVAKAIGYKKGVRIKWGNFVGEIDGEFYWAQGSICLAVKVRHIYGSYPKNYLPIYDKGIWAEILKD